MTNVGSVTVKIFPCSFHHYCRDAFLNWLVINMLRAFGLKYPWPLFETLQLPLDHSTGVVC